MYRDVPAPICPVCHKPFTGPVGCCDELVIVNATTGEAVYAPDWIAEHEDCGTAWAGYNSLTETDEGTVYKNIVALLISDHKHDMPTLQPISSADMRPERSVDDGLRQAGVWRYARSRETRREWMQRKRAADPMYGRKGDPG